MPYDQIPMSSAQKACSVCPVARACPAGALLRQAVVPLAHAGKSLYAAGDAASAVFVVRAGCLKAFTVDPQGNERVRGFYLPGDVLGLDAFGSAAYPANAVAITPVQVCRISKGELQRAMGEHPGLLQSLLERTSAELRHTLALAGDYTADQRVAAFLLLMQHRLAAPGSAQFVLPMTRRDIANHLRLATETVCRVLVRFQDAGWLVADDRRIRLVRRDALCEQAGPVGLGSGRQSLALAA